MDNDDLAAAARNSVHMPPCPRSNTFRPCILRLWLGLADCVPTLFGQNQIYT